MKIKEVKAKAVLDSRGEKTIAILVNGCWASAPFGKSIGRHEKPPYKKNPAADIKFINHLLKKSPAPKISSFEELRFIEHILKNKVGANTLFALEASMLKALAKSQGKELFQIIGRGRKIPLLISNTVGGGVHNKSAGRRPDFQEFHVIGTEKQNKKACREMRKLLKAKTRNDESAWETRHANDEVLELMRWAKLKIGVDIAASQFHFNGKYYYKNPGHILTRKEQIEYIIDMIKEYGLDYVEDPLHENDFSGFAEILRAVGGKCLIAGDDLTTTNLKRVKKAIKMKSINGLIVKPNQIGSLLEVRKVIELCKKHNVKIIMSHRSGETNDSTIADLAVGFGCDYIKIPVAGKERLAKVKRLRRIERT